MSSLAPGSHKSAKVEIRKRVKEHLETLTSDDIERQCV